MSSTRKGDLILFTVAMLLAAVAGVSCGYLIGYADGWDALLKAVSAGEVS